MMKRRLLLLGMGLLLVVTACGGTDDPGAGPESEGVASLSAAAGDVVAAPQQTEETVAPVEEVAGVTTTQEPAAPTQEEALLAFTACMRDNGVDIEDPTVDAGGSVTLRFRGAGPGDESFDREATEAARKACSDHLEGVALTFGRTAEERTEVEDMLYTYAACMRTNGFEMDDPDFSTHGGGGGGGGSETGLPRRLGPVDTEDPDFIAAHAVCSDILSGFVPGGGLGGGE